MELETILLELINECDLTAQGRRQLYDAHRGVEYLVRSNDGTLLGAARLSGGNVKLMPSGHVSTICDANHVAVSLAESGSVEKIIWWLESLVDKPRGQRGT